MSLNVLKKNEKQKNPIRNRSIFDNVRVSPAGLKLLIVPFKQKITGHFGVVENFNSGFVKYGSELIINGGFLNGTTNWSIYNVDCSVINNQAVIINSGAEQGYIQQSNVIPANDTSFYKVSFDINSISGTVLANFNGANYGHTYTTTGTKEFGFQYEYAYNANLRIGTTAGSSATINNVSIKKLSNGNHGVITGSFDISTATDPFSWRFDGSDDEIVFGNVLNLGTNDAIWFGWFNLYPAPDTYYGMITKYVGGGIGWDLGILSSGVVDCAIRDGVNSPSRTQPAQDVCDGHWHLFVTMRQDNTLTTILPEFNISDESTLIAADTDLSNSADLTFGSRSSSNHFTGRLSLFGLYIFDGTNGSPAQAPSNFSKFAKEIYNNTKHYFGETSKYGQAKYGQSIYF